MKYGLIYTKDYLSKLFSSEGVKEVYSDASYSFPNVSTLYLLSSKCTNHSFIVQSMIELYGKLVKVYYSYLKDDILFRDRVLIWKNGEWYV